MQICIQGPIITITVDNHVQDLKHWVTGRILNQKTISIRLRLRLRCQVSWSHREPCSVEPRLTVSEWNLTIFACSVFAFDWSFLILSSIKVHRNLKIENVVHTCGNRGCAMVPDENLRMRIQCTMATLAFSAHDTHAILARSLSSLRSLPIHSAVHNCIQRIYYTADLVHVYSTVE